MNKSNAHSLPTRLHIGTQRAASSFLYNLLKQHPDASLSEEQETAFFIKHYDRGKEYYASLFPTDGLRIDTSPKYFMKGETVAPRIAQTLPVGELRFLLVLRNPIDYVYSHFRMHKRNGYFRAHPELYPELTPDLSEHIQRYPFYAERGRYATILQGHWLKHFRLSQFKVVLFERLIDETQPVLREIQAFFDLPPQKLETPNTSKNATLRYSFLYPLRNTLVRVEPLKQWLKQSSWFNDLYERYLTEERSRVPDGERQQIMSHFERDVSRLKSVLNRPLSRWNDFDG